MAKVRRYDDWDTDENEVSDTNKTDAERIMSVTTALLTITDKPFTFHTI